MATSVFYNSHASATHGNAEDLRKAIGARARSSMLGWTCRVSRRLRLSRPTGCSHLPVGDSCQWGPVWKG